MSKVYTAAQTGTVVEADKDILLRDVLLTAGADDATLSLSGNGNVLIKLAAKAGTSATHNSTSGGLGFALDNIPKPVTITTTGTLPFARLGY